MSYKKIIEAIDGIDKGTAYEQRVILIDIKFMLEEFKKEKKLSFVDMKDIMDLVSYIAKEYTGHDPERMKIWRYDSYFRLKALYLVEIGGIIDARR